MAGQHACPLLSVRPCRALVDEKLDVTVQNLLPGQEVTLHALIHSEDGDFWEAFGHYVSDASGAVKVVEVASMGGSYTSVEPMGLLWSMRPVPGSRNGLRLRKKDVQAPTVVHISVHDGHVTQGFREQSPLTCSVIERWYTVPGVRRVEVAENGIRGTLFLPPGSGPFPGLLDLWGGGGGLVEYRSALLASHGYATLALEYMTPKTTLTTTVGTKYFETAFILLKNHPEVCEDSVGIFSLSFGTSVALGMAAYSSVIHPRCLVCVSGSHVQPVNGSLSDVFAEIGKNSHKARYDEENRVIWRDLILPIPTDPSKKVDVGKIECPVLFIVGEDDQNWPTSESAEDMERMMKEAGKSHLFTRLSYPGTGHLIEPPYSPHICSSNFMTAEGKVLVLWGGETLQHSRAQEDSWQKALAFLDQHLYNIAKEA